MLGGIFPRTAAILVRWNQGFDEYAQHSLGKIADWRTWYYRQTAFRRYNIERPGHGIRAIRP